MEQLLVRAEEKLSLARAAALFKAPYFSSVVHGFVFRPMPDIGTMCCSRSLILGFNPEYVDSCQIEELAADVVHEVHHFIRRHFDRAFLVEDPDLWNLAGDCAINPDMRAGGWRFATGDKAAVFPEDFGLPPDQTIEQYYELLRTQQQQQQGQEPDPQEGDGGPGGKKKGKGPGKTPKQGEQPGAGPPTTGKGICGGRCGGIGGRPSSAESALEAEPGLGRPPSEIQSIGKRVANDIRQHAAQNGRGSVPGGLIDLLQNDDMLPVIRWQDELASILRDTTGRVMSGGDDFTLSRPSKRSIIRGFLRPGLVEHLPEVCIIRDSSGSMGAEQLLTATTEAYGIMAALGIDEVWFADADTEVAMPWKRVGAMFFRNLKEVRGRGGTDFRPGIEGALKLNPKPDIIVYLTDGDGTTTSMPPPNAAVVWAIVPSYYNKAPAKWGHAVIISDDPKKRRQGAVYDEDEKDETEDAEDDE
jgi:predicted metal-dependent peptidase